LRNIQTARRNDPVALTIFGLAYAVILAFVLMPQATVSVVDTAFDAIAGE
jgi:hypothetical protein